MGWNKFRGIWKNGNLVFEGTNKATSGDYIFNNNIKLTLGTGSDAKLYWNGSELQGPNPTSGMWADCPSLAYSDISNYYQWSDDFLQLNINQSSDPIDYTVDTEGAGLITLLNGEYGGIAHLATDGTNNNQCGMQIGTGSSGTVAEITDASGYALWFEVRVRANQTSEGAIFVGLAEENVVTDLIADDGAASYADKDIIGFGLGTDANDEWDFVYRKSSGLKVTDANIATNASDWHTFGFHFDGASVLTPYIDGTAGTAVDTSTATFPSGEEMSPIVTIKTGESATKSVDIDWIRLVGQR